MSYLKRVSDVLRLDKLFTADIITVMSYYVMIVVNIIMITFIVYLFNWCHYILY